MDCIQKGLSLFLFAWISLGCEPQKATEDPGAGEGEVANPKRNLSADFREFWYAGDAELSSYSLQQARYGELRQGEAVLIYVTEPFLKEPQVKAESHQKDNIPVLKLNRTKNFLTGIYPYSIMSSTFYPVYDNQHALKVSSSVQEWCGHVYTQFNNRGAYEVVSHSYFEGEADQNLSLPEDWLEDELWVKLRIHPEGLPTGQLQIIPSLEYIRLGHKPIKAYSAEASFSREGDTTTYTLRYPELERSLSIRFSSGFPYTIEGWTETYKSGFGSESRELTTTATLLKRLKIPYWEKNRNKDVILRDSLGI